MNDPASDSTEATPSDRLHEVRYDVRDHVATLTLDAPERMNTISPVMLHDISELPLRADHDPDFHGR